MPSRADLPERLETVLQVIYLVFNEGYSASSGESLTRADLSGEAIRLGGLLLELLPEPEVIGLLALMLHPRIAPAGADVADGRSDSARGSRSIALESPADCRRHRARERALADRRVGRTRFKRRSRPSTPRRDRAETDWAQIAALYGCAPALEPSPVIELNRAVAVAMRDGPEAGLI